jgi:hypothetical protein
MVAREFVNLVARVRFPPHTHLVPKSSGEDARLSTAIGEFDPRRDRSRGGMCQGGELHLQCGCGRFDSGPLHDLDIAVTVTAARHARLVCERARFDPE